MRRVDDQVAGGGEDGATEIEPLLDVDAGGRVAQRDAHLLGDAGEVVVEDLQHHRIGHRSRNRAVTRSMTPTLATWTAAIRRAPAPRLRQPGSMTVVDVGS